MFLEDELEYVRLKRADNIMGWLAILFVAALVFMFAGLMNSASASGSGHPAPSPVVQSVELEHAPGILALNSLFETGRSPLIDASAAAGNAQLIPAALPLNLETGAHRLEPAFSAEAAQVTAEPASASFSRMHHTTTADRDIMMGLMLLVFALMGSSFVMLAFGGPRDIGGVEEHAER